MKQYLNLLILILMLLSTAITGCGGSSSGGGGSAPIGGDSIYVKVFSKDTLQPVDARLQIIETKSEINTGFGQTQIKLAQGKYTMYVSKPGYLTQGYSFNKQGSDLIFNIYLNQENPVQSRGTVSGNVLEGGSAYSGSYNILAGNEMAVDYYNGFTSSAFNIQSVRGKITISVYTIKGETIDKIAYQKRNLEHDLSGVDLHLPVNPLIYRGTKPSGDYFTVKLKDGSILAEQNSNLTTFKFGVQLLEGDEVFLESLRQEGDVGYFTRLAAGSSGGGSYNLSYQQIVPEYSISSDDLNYQLNFGAFNAASFDYFEVYAIQFNLDNQGNIQGKAVPFRLIGLSGTGIKVPKSLLDGPYQHTYIYLRGIKLPGFNLNKLLCGLQEYGTYSYIEKGTAIGLGGMSITTHGGPSLVQLKAELKKKLNLNRLCTE